MQGRKWNKKIKQFWLIFLRQRFPFANPEGVWGSAHIVPFIHDLEISWRWVVSLAPGQLYSRETPGTYSVEGWVSCGIGVDTVEKINLSGIEPLFLGVSASNVVTTNYAIPAQKYEGVRRKWLWLLVKLLEILCENLQVHVTPNSETEL